MERIVIEIFVGIFIFILGLLIGTGLACICRSNGEAEDKLNKDKRIKELENELKMISTPPTKIIYNEYGTELFQSKFVMGFRESEIVTEEMIKAQMCKELAEAMMPYVEIVVWDDPRSHERTVLGKIRVCVER